MKSRKDGRHEGPENEFVAEKDKTEQSQANDEEQNIMKDHLGLFSNRLLRVLHRVLCFSSDEPPVSSMTTPKEFTAPG